MDETADRRFGRLLRAHRVAAGISQEELAERAHLSRRTITNLERGVTAPYRETVALLADALALTESDRAELEHAVHRARTPSITEAVGAAASRPPVAGDINPLAATTLEIPLSVPPIAAEGLAIGEPRPLQPILATKLVVPGSSLAVLPRPRLLQRLSDGPLAKLTLVCAPAGAGKTTLLAEWSRQTDRGVAWVSLEERDSEPRRFWTYVIEALTRWHAGVGAEALALLSASPAVPMETVLSTLLNDLAALPDAGILILDDYHVIADRAIHDALGFLLDHLPPQLRLAIGARADPFLPLARLRVRGQLTEVRDADLRCTPEEAAAFLTEVMSVALSENDVAALRERTEGWIAGLQLAALSLRGRADAHDFVTAFTGTNRHIVDYLVQEVLERLSNEILTFLLQTSILSALSAPLCDAVTGRADGQTTLEFLERANLFLVPLDDQRMWFRYHRLFADVLQQRLRSTHPEQLVPVHRRAATWYEERGWVGDAIAHALAAEDQEWAARLVELHAEDALEWSEINALQEWLALLPQGLIRSRLRLSITAALVSVLKGRAETIEPHLEDVERAYDRERPTERTGADDGWAAESADTVCCHNRPGSPFADVATTIGVLRGTVASVRGDLVGCIALAERSLTRLPRTGLLHDMVVRDLGMATWLSGDLTRAAQVFADVAEHVEEADRYTDLFGWYSLGQIRIAQGRLQEAADTFRAMMRLGEGTGRLHRRMTSWGRLGLGAVLCEWNDLDAAAHHLMLGIDEARQLGSRAAVTHGFLALARVQTARGDVAGAEESLSQAREWAPRVSVAPCLFPIAAAQVRLWLAQGNVAAARWAENSGLRADDELTYLREADHIALARVLAAQERNAAPSALHLLARLLEAATEGGRVGHAIEILLLQSRIHLVRQEADAARAALERALILAEPEGYVRLFAEEGESLVPMLLHAVQEGRASKWLRTVLAACRTAQSANEPRVESSSMTSGQANQPLAEPLTERELEVLQLMAEGRKNTEIAAHLFVTLDTVKKHVSHIFGKLGVVTRTEAVARARDLGLLV